jgi:chromosomal replication initiator protein
MLPNQRSDEHDVDRLLARLAETIGERKFRHWFDGKTRLRLEGDLLRVDAASPYLLNWIQRQYGRQLQQAAHDVCGQGLRLQFDVDATMALVSPAGEGAEAEAARPSPAVTRTTKAVGAATSRLASHGSEAAPASGRRQADLRDLVVGPCNELAFTAASQVAAAPGAQYSPLFLYAGVGNGKSHLLEGIARQIKRGFPALQVLLLTSENFTNYFTRALSERSLPSFRQKFRGCDVLLVDDVDFLEGKKGIQEEFLHTLQQLEAAGRQIVLAGDRHPRLMTKLSDELMTRFLSGLVCRIDSPALEVRREIVKRLAERRKFPVSDGALDYIASRFTHNARELVGAINCLSVWHSLHHKKVSVSAARQVLASLERDCLKVVRLADVEQAVCALFGVTSKDLKSASRTRTLAQPRMLAMYLARRLTNTAYGDIGRYFGDRNHSTALAAERKVAAQVESNDSIRIASEDWTLRDVVQTLEQQILAG